MFVIRTHKGILNLDSIEQITISKDYSEYNIVARTKPVYSGGNSCEQNEYILTSRPVKEETAQKILSQLYKTMYEGGRGFDFTCI